MTPTTLSGEYHMSEVEFLTQHPFGGRWHLFADLLREGLWPSVIDYAERHAAEVGA